MSLRTFSFYHAETGELHERVFSTDDEALLAANTPGGHVPIAGAYDHVMPALRSVLRCWNQLLPTRRP